MEETGEPQNLPSLFLMSLTILGLYLIFGASVYSRVQNVPIVDAIFVCYDMLSVSNLPSSFGLTDSPTFASILPESYKFGMYKDSKLHLRILKSDSNNTKRIQHDYFKQNKVKLGGETEWLLWQTLYLICGLNLVSICGQFAKFWFSANDDDDDDFEQVAEIFEPICNGYGSSGGNFNPGGQSGAQFATFQPSSKPDYMMQTVMQTTETQLLPTSAHTQQQQQIDLAELFVVSQQTTPVEIQYPGLQQQQQHSQLASDVSFASDRSTERGSLCQLHQASVVAASTMPSLANGASGAIYGGSKQHSSCGRGHHQMALGGRKEHLYLAGGGQFAGHVLHAEEDEEDDVQEEDDYEMDRMLKTCIGGNQRSSSSSIHLSNSNAYLASNTIDIGFNQPHSHSLQQQQHQQQQQQQLESGSSARTLSTGRQLRVVEPNGCEQDNSLNTMDTTNSNTISSVSSRTIKLPQHIHIHNGIGFVLDGTNSSNDQS